MKINVILWGKTIGELIENNNQYYFSYAKDFLKSGIELSPIHMKLMDIQYNFSELNYKPFFGLPGLLADSLPDKYGTKLINEYLDAEGRDHNSLTIGERLAYIGSRGMGALEFVPDQLDIRKDSTNINIDRLIELSNDVLSERKSLSADDRDVKTLIKVGTSAGGARAKAIVAYNREKHNFKSGQIDAGNGYEYYLLKFDGIEKNQDKDKEDTIYQTRIEYAYYLMAISAGITMMPSEQIIQDGKYHFMTKRFDRYVEDGKMQKLHTQTLCAMDHVRFDEFQNYSYERAAKLFQQLGLRYQEREELFRRMVFNVITKNYDDHTKNISFIMDKTGKWRLAPAYDMTFAFDPTGSWNYQHQMLINNKGIAIGMDDLIAAGNHMDIKSPHIPQIIHEVSEAAHKFLQFAKKASLPDDIAESLYSFFEFPEQK